eukprot:5299980-Amphidinium_carterae.1
MALFTDKAWFDGMVDDIAIQAHGNAQQVVQTIAEAEEHVVQQLSDLHLPLDGRVVLCSSAAVSRELSNHEYQWERQARNLGAQLAPGCKTKTVVTRGSLRKARTWITRARCLRRAGAKIRGILRTGAIQSVGYADHIIHSVPKTSCPIRYAWVHGNKSSGFPIHRHHANVIGELARTICLDRFPRKDLQKAVRQAARKLCRAVRPNYVVLGPITGLLNTCVQLGWQVTCSPTTMEYSMTSKVEAPFFGTTGPRSKQGKGRCSIQEQTPPHR